MGDNTDRRQEVSTCAPSSNSIYRSTRAARSKSSGLSWRRRGFLLRRVNFSFSSTRRLLRDDFFLHLGSRRSSALATCCRCRNGRGFSLGFARRASSGGGVLLYCGRSAGGFALERSAGSITLLTTPHRITKASESKSVLSERKVIKFSIGSYKNTVWRTGFAHHEAEVRLQESVAHHLAKPAASIPALQVLNSSCLRSKPKSSSYPRIAGPTIPPRWSHRSQPNKTESPSLHGLLLAERRECATTSAPHEDRFRVRASGWYTEKTRYARRHRRLIRTHLLT